MAYLHNTLKHAGVIRSGIIGLKSTSRCDSPADFPVTVLIGELDQLRSALDGCPCIGLHQAIRLASL